MITSPEKRARSGTILFGLFGVLGVIIAPKTPFLVVTVIFYILMLWHTYYSVRYFSGIISPQLPSQKIVDAVLTVLYFASVFFFSSPTYFNLMMLLLLATATLKYAIALPRIGTPSLLYRKIIVEAMGTLASGLALGGAALGYPWISMTLWTAVLAGGSIYTILVNPLYQRPLQA